MKNWKRSISLLLVCIMLLTLAPMTASGTVDLGSAALYAANSLPFTDVHTSNWFYSYVRHMHTNGIMNGTTPTTFAPHETFTRAQVLATLFRIHTGRTSNANDPRTNNFTDVAPTSWTAPYVTWAANNGITPTTSGTFGPNQSAERQEIALYIHRYVINLTSVSSSSVANAQWNAFTDRGQISGQGNYNALRWANNNDIMRGRTATTIVPGGTATRAEAAAMLVRLMNVLDSGGTTPPPEPDDRATEFEQEVFRLVNIARANAGVAPLQWHAGLGTVARNFSRDMYTRDFFSHICPDGTYPWDRMEAAGITGFWFAAENIAAGRGTPQDVVDAWMNSPGHRENILAPEATHLGVGFHNYFWTQKFIGL